MFLDDVNELVLVHQLLHAFDVLLTEAHQILQVFNIDPEAENVKQEMIDLLSLAPLNVIEHFMNAFEHSAHLVHELLLELSHC